MPLISLRMEDTLLERLKAAAEKHDVGYQTLLKMLVQRGLYEIENADHVKIPDEVRRAKRPRRPKTEQPAAVETPVAEDVVPKPDAPSATLNEDEMDDLFASL